MFIEDDWEMLHEEFELFHATHSGPNFDWSPDLKEIAKETMELLEAERKNHERPGIKLHLRSYCTIFSEFKYYRPVFRSGFGRGNGVRYFKRLLARAERRASKELIREALEF